MSQKSHRLKIVRRCSQTPEKQLESSSEKVVDLLQDQNDNGDDSFFNQKRGTSQSMYQPQSTSIRKFHQETISTGANATIAREKTQNGVVVETTNLVSKKEQKKASTSRLNQMKQPRHIRSMLVTGFQNRPGNHKLANQQRQQQQQQQQSSPLRNFSPKRKRQQQQQQQQLLPKRQSSPSRLTSSPMRRQITITKRDSLMTPQLNIRRESLGGYQMNQQTTTIPRGGNGIETRNQLQRRASSLVSIRQAIVNRRPNVDLSDLSTWSYQEAQEILGVDKNETASARLQRLTSIIDSMIHQDRKLNLINRTIEKSMRIGDDIVPEAMKKKEEEEEEEERLMSGGSRIRQSHHTLNELHERRRSLRSRAKKIFGKNVHLGELMFYFGESGKEYKENEAAELQKILKTVKKNKQFHDDIVSYVEEKEAQERQKRQREEMNRPKIIDLLESAPAALQSKETFRRQIAVKNFATFSASSVATCKSYEVQSESVGIQVASQSRSRSRSRERESNTSRTRSNLARSQTNLQSHHSRPQSKSSLKPPHLRGLFSHGNLSRGGGNLSRKLSNADITGAQGLINRVASPIDTNTNACSVHLRQKSVPGSQFGGLNHQSSFLVPLPAPASQVVAQKMLGETRRASLAHLHTQSMVLNPDINFFQQQNKITTESNNSIIPKSGAQVSTQLRNQESRGDSRLTTKQQVQLLKLPTNDNTGGTTSFRTDRSLKYVSGGDSPLKSNKPSIITISEGVSQRQRQRKSQFVLDAEEDERKLTEASAKERRTDMRIKQLICKATRVTPAHVNFYEKMFHGKRMSGHRIVRGADGSIRSIPRKVKLGQLTRATKSLTNIGIAREERQSEVAATSRLQPFVFGKSDKVLSMTILKGYRPPGTAPLQTSGLIATDHHQQSGRNFHQRTNATIKFNDQQQEHQLLPQQSKPIVTKIKLNYAKNSNWDAAAETTTGEQPHQEDDDGVVVNHAGLLEHLQAAGRDQNGGGHSLENAGSPLEAAQWTVKQQILNISTAAAAAKQAATVTLAPRTPPQIDDYEESQKCSYNDINQDLPKSQTSLTNHTFEVHCPVPGAAAAHTATVCQKNLNEVDTMITHQQHKIKRQIRDNLEAINEAKRESRQMTRASVLTKLPPFTVIGFPQSFVELKEHKKPSEQTMTLKHNRTSSMGKLKGSLVNSAALNSRMSTISKLGHQGQNGNKEAMAKSQKRLDSRDHLGGVGGSSPSERAVHFNANSTSSLISVPSIINAASNQVGGVGKQQKVQILGRLAGSRNSETNYDAEENVSRIDTPLKPVNFVQVLDDNTGGAATTRIVPIQQMNGNQGRGDEIDEEPKQYKMLRYFHNAAINRKHLKSQVLVDQMRKNRKTMSLTNLTSLKNRKIVIRSDVERQDVSSCGNQTTYQQQPPPPQPPQRQPSQTLQCKSIESELEQILSESVSSQKSQKYLAQKNRQNSFTETYKEKLKKFILPQHSQAAAGLARHHHRNRGLSKTQTQGFLLPKSGATTLRSHKDDQDRAGSKTLLIRDYLESLDSGGDNSPKLIFPFEPKQKVAIVNVNDSSSSQQQLSNGQRRLSTKLGQIKPKVQVKQLAKDVAPISQSREGDSSIERIEREKSKILLTTPFSQEPVNIQLLAQLHKQPDVVTTRDAVRATKYVGRTK